MLDDRHRGSCLGTVGETTPLPFGRVAVAGAVCCLVIGGFMGGQQQALQASGSSLGAVQRATEAAQLEAAVACEGCSEAVRALLLLDLAFLPAVVLTAAATLLWLASVTRGRGGLTRVLLGLVATAAVVDGLRNAILLGALSGSGELLWLSARLSPLVALLAFFPALYGLGAIAAHLLRPGGRG